MEMAMKLLESEQSHVPRTIIHPKISTSKILWEVPEDSPKRARTQLHHKAAPREP